MSCATRVRSSKPTNGKEEGGEIHPLIMNIVKLRQDFYKIKIAAHLTVRSQAGLLMKDTWETLVFRTQPDITITENGALAPFCESVLANVPVLNTCIGRSDVLDRCLNVYMDHVKKVARETEPFEVGSEFSVSGIAASVTRCEDYEMSDLTPAFKNMTIRFYLERK